MVSYVVMCKTFTQQAWIFLLSFLFVIFVKMMHWTINFVFGLRLIKTGTCGNIELIPEARRWLQENNRHFISILLITGSISTTLLICQSKMFAKQKFMMPSSAVDRAESKQILFPVKLVASTIPDVMFRILFLVIDNQDTGTKQQQTITVISILSIILSLFSMVEKVLVYATAAYTKKMKLKRHVFEMIIIITNAQDITSYSQSCNRIKKLRTMLNYYLNPVVEGVDLLPVKRCDGIKLNQVHFVATIYVTATQSKSRFEIETKVNNLHNDPETNAKLGELVKNAYELKEEPQINFETQETIIETPYRSRHVTQRSNNNLALSNPTNQQIAAGIVG